MSYIPKARYCSLSRDTSHHDRRFRVMSPITSGDCPKNNWVQLHQTSQSSGWYSWITLPARRVAILTWFWIISKRNFTLPYRELTITLKLLTIVVKHTTNQVLLAAVCPLIRYSVRATGWTKRWDYRQRKDIVLFSKTSGSLLGLISQE
jgi:hypothetical protein